MVHEKKKSGDPDYDDKVPLDTQGMTVVTAGDGREVRISKSVGPTNPDGSHANLDDPKGDQGDNRPAPGGVAEKDSDVQTYDAADVPRNDLGTVNSSQELADLTPTEDRQQAGQSGDAANEETARPRGSRRSRTSE